MAPITRTDLPPIGVTDLTVRFGQVVALDTVTLRAEPGHVTAIVGGDGAGKSTLLRVLANRVRADMGVVRTLERARIGYQPSTSGVWRTLTVHENLDFVGRSYGMDAARLRNRSSDLLERAGLCASRNRLGEELSGGMRQKLGFVLAMLHEPKLLLLDEPSTGVDPVSRVELWRLIALAAGGGTTVIMTTTYLDEAQRSTFVLALHSGRMIASGEPDAIIAAVPGTIARLHERDESLDERFGGRSWRRGTERHLWVPPGSLSPDHTEMIARRDFEDALIALSLASAAISDTAASTSLASVLKPGPARRAPSAAASAPIASARHLSKAFDRTAALTDISLDVRAGDILGLIGPNGAGKTTLLRMLLGLERPSSGDAALFGHPPENTARRRLGYVPQGLGLYSSLSVQENVAFLSRIYGVPLPKLPPGLRHLRSRTLSDIGLGRQRQLAFVLALSHTPELLVLDEPTSGVDPLSRAQLWDVIHQQAEAGRAVIVTTHSLQEAEQCSSLLVLAQGVEVGRGTVGQLTRNATAVIVQADDWQEAFSLLDRSSLPIMLDGRNIRVAGRAGNEILEREVRDALGPIPAAIGPTTATLEEAIALIDA